MITNAVVPAAYGAGPAEACNTLNALESLPVVYAPVDDFKSQRIVGALSRFVVDEGVGPHFETAPCARPVLGGAHEGAADSAMSSPFADKPALDKADRTRGTAAVGMRSQPHLEKTERCAALVDRHQERERQPAGCLAFQDRIDLLPVVFD